MIKTFKRRSFRNPDESVSQEMSVDSCLKYDYSDTSWVSLDTEFLSLDMQLDKLSVIQIASIDPENEDNVRVEILHVFNTDPCEGLIKLMKNPNITKIFHSAFADLPRIEKYINAEIEGEIYDTYMAAKLILTNIKEYSLEYLIQYLVNPYFVKNKVYTYSEWDIEIDKWEEEMFEYAANDVLYLNEIKNRLSAIAQRRGRSEVVESTMKTIKPLSNLVKLGYTNFINLF